MRRLRIELSSPLFSFRRMSPQAREVRPGPGSRNVLLNEYGIVEAVPHGWTLLPPGDAALSRRIKQDGPTLTVIETKGRKRFSRGIWAPAERIEALRAVLIAERQEPSYQKQLDAGRRRRANAQEAYAVDFRDAVARFLNFHARHALLAQTVANLIAEHATPVGSGTVARTQRIPIEARAEAATIAWLRHQTTGYDDMVIPRERGRRREVRRMLAQRSVRLLEKYRSGQPIDVAQCPLHRAVAPHLPTRTIG
jgi:hypothetical protein